MTTYTTRVDLMQHPDFADLGTDGDGNPRVWENEYYCGDCGPDQSIWSSEWSCQCDDECSSCGNSVGVTNSIWIGPDDEALRALWESLPEAEGEGFGASVMPPENPQWTPEQLAAMQAGDDRHSSLAGDPTWQALQKWMSEQAATTLAWAKKVAPGQNIPPVKAEAVQRFKDTYSANLWEKHLGKPVPADDEAYYQHENEIVTRSAPRWAWDTIDETLAQDSMSSAFSADLRADIAAAVDAMIIASERASEPISREEVAQ